jgi:hypothetical protein
MQATTASPKASPVSTSLSILRPSSIAAIAVVLTFASCYLRNFVLPHAPILLWGDQMLYAANGARLLAGQMPYRDYFEFLPPGTDLVYALLFRIFGLALWIPNLLMDLLATAAVLLATLAARTILRGPSLALPALFAIGFALFGGLDATHHWFSTVAALAAMLVLLQGTTPRHILTAGALCGIMASFTQSKGAAVTLGFLIYLTCRSRQQHEPSRTRNCLLLCAAAFTSFLVINIHYIAKLGLHEWLRWIVLFSMRYYPTMPGQTLRSPIDDFHGHTGLFRWICVPFLYIGVPLIYISFFWIMQRRRKAEPNQPWEQLLLITITGIAMFLAVSPSLSIMRASAVSMPSTILLAWLLGRLTHPFLWIKWTAATLSLAIGLYLPISTQRMHWNLLTLPSGEAAILDPGRYALYRWMADHTHPGEPYLGIAAMSFPLRLQTPAPIQAPGPWEYYRPEHIARSIAALEAYRIPLLVLRPYITFRGTPGYEQDHIQAYQDYIDLHYRRIATFSTGDEIWQRNP